MAAESPSGFDLEIAHVLFMDIVGYSKLLSDQQRDLSNELNKIVRETQQFRNAEAAGKLIRLPTGDGMALAFFTNPEAPLKCAIEIAQAAKSLPQLQLRIGLHSGPVSGVTDVNDRSNVAGAGINIAQRVMDCGDAGHILLSKRIADDLAQYTRWRPCLHELGEIDAKHGVRIDISNLFGDGFGNPNIPAKYLQQSAAKAALISRSKRKRNLAIGGVVAGIVAIAAAFFFLQRAKEVISGEKSIAVLPLEDMAHDQANSYFVDGLQDDILNSLAKIKNLKVVSRSAVTAYRDPAQRRLLEIGHQLQVAYVLEGSVRQGNNHVVVNVQLTGTHSGRPLWSEHYDRTLTDVLSLQGELAIEIARNLHTFLTPQEKTSLATKPTSNAQAYLLYLKGREVENVLRLNEVDWAGAVKLYQQAIDLDPAFALARARLSIASSWLADSDESPARKAKAKAEAEEGLRLQPQLGEGHLALAYCYYLGDKNYDQALAELSKADELIPNSPEVPRVRAFVYRRQDKIRERISALERATTLDPRDATSLSVLAITLRGVRDWPEELRTRERILEIRPEEAKIPWARALAEFHATGDLNELKKVIEHAPPDADPMGLKMVSFELAVLTRDFSRARRTLAQIPEEVLENFPYPSQCGMRYCSQSAALIRRQRKARWKMFGRKSHRV